MFTSCIFSHSPILPLEPDGRELTSLLRTLRKFPNLTEFSDLTYDIKVKAMQAHISDVQHLIEEQTCSITDTNELNGLDIFNPMESVTCHSGTTIVSKIENILRQRMIMITDILLSQNAKEEPLFQRKEATDHFKNLLTNLFQTIVNSVKSLEILDQDKEAEDDDRSKKNKSSTATVTSNFEESLPEQKILTALSNVEKMIGFLPIFISLFESHDFPGCESVKQEMLEKCKKEIQNLSTEYIDTVSDTLIIGIESRMYSNNFDWENNLDEMEFEDYSPRPYVGSILLDLARVLSECSVFCPTVSDTIIDQCIYKIIEELNRVFKCIGGKIDVDGSKQLYFDMLALQSGFQKFKLSATNDRLLRDMFGFLESKVTEFSDKQRREVQDQLVETYIQDQELIFECFTE